MHIKFYIITYNI